jgi:hypothetical protein
VRATSASKPGSARRWWRGRVRGGWFVVTESERAVHSVRLGARVCIYLLPHSQRAQRMDVKTTWVGATGVVKSNLRGRQPPAWALPHSITQSKTPSPRNSHAHTHTHALPGKWRALLENWAILLPLFRVNYFQLDYDIYINVKVIKNVNYCSLSKNVLLVLWKGERNRRLNLSHYFTIC